MKCFQLKLNVLNAAHVIILLNDVMNKSLLNWVLRKNIVAAFRGMQLSPAKHSYAWLPRKCAYRTDTQTGRQTDGQTAGRRTKSSLCAAMLRRRHKNSVSHADPITPINALCSLHCYQISVHPMCLDSCTVHKEQVFCQTVKIMFRNADKKSWTEWYTYRFLINSISSQCRRILCYVFF